MKMVSILAAVAVSGLSGCIWNDGCDNCHDTEEVEACEVKTNVHARYLVVGMETSKRFGSCAGCELDAKRLEKLLSGTFKYDGDTLISEQATKAEVVKRLKEGISKTPEGGLFIFCYSGHGGQEYLGGKEPDGAERQDEYLCLYDTYMQDDEIWDIVSKCKGRVFLYFDACHSATMYRSVASDVIKVSPGEAVALEGENLVKSTGISFRVGDMAHALSAEEGESRGTPSLMCWSGCKELEYSYGGSSGGVMTTSLVKRWKKGITYRVLWNHVAADVQKEQPTQHPVFTSIGKSWAEEAEAFK